MAFEQQRMQNPFGMDEACTACPALTESRSGIVHGYGDVDAEFVFVTEHPSATADETGVPVTTGPEPDPLSAVLMRLGFLGAPDAEADTEVETDEEGHPVVTNAYLTRLTRCRHPDRGPTDQELTNCEAFLSSEIRMINPEIIVPVGQRPLRVLAAEYTTDDPTEFRTPEHHATPIRGRGFELVPMRARGAITADQCDAFVETMRELMATDYRQTKGRQGR